MLLDSLRSNAGALQSLRATHLVRDMADRIRVNLPGREHYDTRRLTSGGVCAGPDGCNAAQLAAADHARFVADARALFLHEHFTAHVEYEPATGPATPDRYVITLSWRASGEAADDSSNVSLLVLAQPPVAG
jgi:hypothetical protein